MSIAVPHTGRFRTPFIGRVRERKLVPAELEAQAALVSLVGPAGIGKTRLARQLIADVAPAFAEGGTWFCNLTPCQSAGEVEATVARMLGVPQVYGDDLAHSLAHRGRTLLVLDNLDSLAQVCCPLLERWLDRADGLQIIATSIVPSGFEGEVRFELGPLLLEDAIELYLDRAHRAWAGHSLPPEERAAVEELVSRLDRFPLAIELAAARVRVFSPKALLARLDRRFEFLRLEGSGRHDSLLEALRLTWELLSDVEKDALSRASVFEGSFSYEAAEAILELDAKDGPLFDLLDSLRGKALLQLEESHPPRYLLFESVREFGRQSLRAEGSWEENAARHASYFVEIGEEKAACLEGPLAMEAAGWLEQERENLVAVVQRNLKSDPGLAARAGLAFAALLDVEDCPPSLITFLETILDAARDSGEPSLILRALRYHASALAQSESVDSALAELEEALELSRQLGDRREEGEVQNRRAIILLRSGEVERALDVLSEATDIGREQGDPLIEGTAWMHRAGAEHFYQHLEDAEASCRRAIRLFREHAHHRLEGLALNVLAGCLVDLERFREARQVLQEALERARQLKNRRLEAISFAHLGTTNAIAGRLEEGEAYLVQALEAQSEQGNRRLEGILLGNLGIVSLEDGELEAADAKLSKSAQILMERGDRRGQAVFLPFLAVVDSFLGRKVEAKRNLEDAREFFLEMDDQPNLLMTEIVEALLDLIEARLLPGDSDAGSTQAQVEQSREKLRMATSPEGRRTAGMHSAIRLLTQELEGWPAAAGAPGSAGQETLRIGVGGGWFQVGEGERIDLRRRVAIRRVLDTLAERRIASPGAAIDPFELFGIAWTGVEIDPETAKRRLYFGVWTLRKLGLAEILLHQTDGYLLDPEVAIERVA